MSVAIDGLIFGWKKNAVYGASLVKDLDQDQMILQPATGDAPSNHPSWVFSHLNAYLPIIECLILGNDFQDPKDHQFGMLSKPENDASIYASKDELVNQFTDGHQRIVQLLTGADDSILDAPVNLPRWKEVMPKVGIALPYLMLNHENTHLGQLSAWRRIQGLPSV